MKIEDVSFIVRSDKEVERELAATYFEPDNPCGAAVLFLSGYESIRQKYMRYAVEIGNTVNVASLTLDFGGHGQSEGNLRNLKAPDHLNDALAAFDFCRISLQSTLTE